MTTDPQRFEAQLEAYLDGTLSAEARTRFERRLQRDEQLRRKVELARRIDHSLRQSFAPAATPHDAAKQADEKPHHAVPRATIDRSERRSPQAGRRWVRTLVAAVAVCLVWIAVGAVYYWMFRDPFGGGRSYSDVTMVQVYNAEVAKGFQPLWVCENPREFAETFQRRQGQPLLLAEMDAESRMAGLAYLKGLQETSTSMLAWVDESPVIVWVDRTSADRTVPQPQPSTGLHLHRRARGALVFYELSPYDEAQVIPYFYETSSLPPAEMSWADLWR